VHTITAAVEVVFGVTALHSSHLKNLLTDILGPTQSSILHIARLSFPPALNYGHLIYTGVGDVRTISLPAFQESALHYRDVVRNYADIFCSRDFFTATMRSFGLGG
jgi:hypothetical protein